MRLEVKETGIEVTGADGSLAGRYVYSDPYKPYLHPLLTPSGVAMSTMVFVIWMSARDGVGSPLGWLWIIPPNSIPH